MSARLEPKPTQQPPKASSIVGKMSLHQCQYDTGKMDPNDQRQNLLWKTGDNKNQILRAWNKHDRERKC